jgi:hypothetical protein
MKPRRTVWRLVDGGLEAEPSAEGPLHELGRFDTCEAALASVCEGDAAEPVLWRREPYPATYLSGRGARSGRRYVVHRETVWG